MGKESVSSFQCAESECQPKFRRTSSPSSKKAKRAMLGFGGDSVSVVRLAINQINQKSLPMGVLTCALVILACLSTSSCAVVSDSTAESNLIRNDTQPQQTQNGTLFVTPAKSNSSDSNDATEEDDYYYSDEYDSSGENCTGSGDGRRRRHHDNTKLAQVIVYFSVIIIALAGVLIRYFVTQYETSQLKAQEQMHYQRLQTQPL